MVDLFLNKKIDTEIEFIKIGSHTRYTNIEFSDIDYLIVLSKEEFYRGYSFIKEKITYLFNDYSIVELFPAFHLVKNNIEIDITPCTKLKTHKTKFGELDIFLIHQAYETYEKTCPDIHRFFLIERNKYFNNKLLPFIRKLKKWKYKNSIQISSIYIELAAIQYFEKTKYNTDSISSFWNNLEKNNFNDIAYPFNLENPIKAFK